MPATEDQWYGSACGLTYVLLAISARSCREIKCKMPALLCEPFQLSNAEKPSGAFCSETSTPL